MVVFFPLPRSLTAPLLNRNSINAQKLSDERHGPFKPHNYFRAEMRTHTNCRPSYAISAYAGQDAGNAKSFRAMRYYQSQFAETRDAILTEIAREGWRGG